MSLECFEKMNNCEIFTEIDTALLEISNYVKSKKKGCLFITQFAKDEMRERKRRRLNNESLSDNFHSDEPPFWLLNKEGQQSENLDEDSFILSTKADFIPIIEDWTSHLEEETPLFEPHFFTEPEFE